MFGYVRLCSVMFGYVRFAAAAAAAAAAGGHVVYRGTELV